MPAEHPAPLTHGTLSSETLSMDCSGGCHCGNIHVLLRLTKPPEDNPLRACTCSFCRSHSPRMLSDPQGFLEVRADDWSLVERYRFETRTCDFLICRRCGVFAAAIAEMAEGIRAVVNVNCLDDRARFTSVPTMHEFEGETTDSRLSRRAANWMPAVFQS
jgi:hypothetical protein